ncbi:MAG: hypothetical protein ACKO37_07610 [Vampirovibrionales bacterium]
MMMTTDFGTFPIGMLPSTQGQPMMSMPSSGWQQIPALRNTGVFASEALHNPMQDLQALGSRATFGQDMGMMSQELNGPPGLAMAGEDIAYQNAMLATQNGMLQAELNAKEPKLQKMEESHTNGLNSFFRGMKKPIDNLLTPGGLATLAGGALLFSVLPAGLVTGVAPFLLAGAAGATALGVANNGLKYLGAKDAWGRSQALEGLGSSFTDGLMLLPAGTATLKGLNTLNKGVQGSKSLQVQNTYELLKNPKQWMNTSVSDLKTATLNPEVYKQASALVQKDMSTAWANRSNGLKGLGQQFEKTTQGLKQWATHLPDTLKQATGAVTGSGVAQRQWGQATT